MGSVLKKREDFTMKRTLYYLSVAVSCVFLMNLSCVELKAGQHAASESSIEETQNT